MSTRSDALGSARGSARGEGPASARSSARGSARGEGAAYMLDSARGGKASGREAFDTARDYMSTARLHTALSALSAERNELLNKLAFIDATLEQEGRKKLSRSRGYQAPNHIGMSKK